ncbi:hypothetical protein QZH41_017321 [Actinostola sp. cb2023]|nr:hypothetical protein QZH41_017321 [Actinostola sp. cb2023]
MCFFKKFFMKLKNPIQFHYYCTFCMEYQGLSIPEDKLCKNRCCLKDLRKKENYSYFIIIPLMCQLRDLIQKPGILDLLTYPVTRSKNNSDAIEDIQDGLLYRKHFGSDGFFKGASDKKRRLKSI